MLTLSWLQAARQLGTEAFTAEPGVSESQRAGLHLQPLAVLDLQAANQVFLAAEHQCWLSSVAVFVDKCMRRALQAVSSAF